MSEVWWGDNGGSPMSASIAELSRQVALIRPCKSVDEKGNCTLPSLVDLGSYEPQKCPGYLHRWGSTSPVEIYDYAHALDQPGIDAWLWELEGELQQAGWTFGYWGIRGEPWYADSPEGKGWDCLSEPGTPEGRVRLVLRAWLEMKK